MITRSLSRLFLAGLIVVAVACGSGGVVGGDCRDGLTQCGRSCVDLDSDEQNCGACNSPCIAGVECAGGICGGTAGSGGSSGEGGAAGAAGTSGAGGVGPCLPPFNTADRCGSCETSCSGETPLCSLWGDEFRCVATCPPPFAVCGGSCVDLGGDPQHCGECGTTCPAACQARMCAPRCSPPYEDCDGVCADPQSNSAHCGECNNRCEEGEECVLGQCELRCVSPLVRCGKECIDIDSDAQHCGACFQECPTGICQGSKCIGATPGQIVLACMTYEQTAQSSPQTVLLGNAVFLPVRNPVRIVAYDQYADPTIATRVDTAIGWAATARNRTFSVTRVSDAAAVPTELDPTKQDVLLIYDQRNAPAGTLGELGAQWAQALDDFALKGGVVVVLSGTSGSGEMTAFISGAGLLATTGATALVAGQSLYNRAPGDAVGVGVLSPFAARKESCAFTTSEVPSGSSVFVVSDVSATGGQGSPVVVHKIRTVD
jgi:hypothetical protein